MDNLLSFFSSLLDILFYGAIVPLFSLIGSLMELMILSPMQLMHLPPALQVALVALLTASASLFLRKLVKAEEKDRMFREKFIAKKKQQEELHRISDWKSREKFAKAMDDDIDEEFNTYLAGKFARYGIAYLLPIFLVLYWLDVTTSYTTVIDLPGNLQNITGIPVMVVFLATYCLCLVGYFTLRKRTLKRGQQEVIY